jgi:hypothetical protein
VEESEKKQPKRQRRGAIKWFADGNAPSTIRSKWEEGLWFMIYD